MPSLSLYIIKTLSWLHYKIDVKGLDAIKDHDGRPILFVSTHPCMADPMVLTSVLIKRFKPRPLVRDLQIIRPILGRIVRDFEPITMPNIQNQFTNGKMSKEDRAYILQESVKLAIAEIKKGRDIIIWPAGRLSRDGYDYFEERSGMYRMIKERPDVRVVAIRSQGLWGSRMSWWKGPDMPLWKVFFIGFFCLIINGFFFMPKRKVTYDFTELTGFEGLSRKEVNQKVQTFFNSLEQPAYEVPLFWWQKTKVYPAAEPKPFKGE